METEIKEVSIGGFWNEEDKDICASVLGLDAFTYLTKCGGAISEGVKVLLQHLYWQICKVNFITWLRPMVRAFVGTMPSSGSLHTQSLVVLFLAGVMDLAVNPMTARSALLLLLVLVMHLQ